MLDENKAKTAIKKLVDEYSVYKNRFLVRAIETKLVLPLFEALD